MLASLSVKHRATWFCYDIFHLQNQKFLFSDPWHCGLNVVDFLGGRNQCVVSIDLYVFSPFYNLHLKNWTSPRTFDVWIVFLFSNIFGNRPQTCPFETVHLLSFSCVYFKIILFYPVSSELVSMTVQKFELKSDWYHFYSYQWTQENCPPQQITFFSCNTCLFFFTFRRKCRG